MGVPFMLIQWVEYLQDHFLLLYCSYYVYGLDVWISTKFFMFFQICIHYFKVRSLSNIMNAIDELIFQDEQGLYGSLSHRT